MVGVARALAAEAAHNPKAFASLRGIYNFMDEFGRGHFDRIGIADGEAGDLIRYALSEDDTPDEALQAEDNELAIASSAEAVPGRALVARLHEDRIPDDDLFSFLK